MEAVILILEDALNQQKEQLNQLNKKTTYKNEKQLTIHSKAITNLYGFIMEIETAIKILQEKNFASDKNCEHHITHKGVCAACGESD